MATMLHSTWVLLPSTFRVNEMIRLTVHRSEGKWMDPVECATEGAKILLEEAMRPIPRVQLLGLLGDLAGVGSGQREEVEVLTQTAHGLREYRTHLVQQ